MPALSSFKTKLTVKRKGNGPPEPDAAVFLNRQGEAWDPVSGTVWDAPDSVLKSLEVYHS